MNVTLGHVSGLFGVRGWVKVHSYCRPPEALLRYREWALVSESGALRPMVLVEGRVQGRGLVASLADLDGVRCEDRDAAAALVGARIEVPRALLPRLPNGQYYWSDLVGLAVESEAGEPLGTVREMTENGAQDVLVVHDGTQERLIPFVRGPIVKAVQPSRGRIVVDWSPDY